MSKISNFKSSEEDERAVSPVIGVILMVAITVILAAVIAAFVLDLGQGQTVSASAGVDFSESGDEVTTQIIEIDRADNIYVRLESGGSTYWVSPNGDTHSSRSSANSWSVGDAVKMDTQNPGNSELNSPSFSGSTIDSVTVIGELEGQDTVIQSWES